MRTELLRRLSRLTALPALPSTVLLPSPFPSPFPPLACLLALSLIFQEIETGTNITSQCHPYSRNNSVRVLRQRSPCMETARCPPGIFANEVWAETEGIEKHFWGEKITNWNDSKPDSSLKLISEVCFHINIRKREPVLELALAALIPIWPSKENSMTWQRFSSFSWFSLFTDALVLKAATLCCCWLNELMFVTHLE